jgi:tyrosine-protein kinase Etk/Wzc
VTQPEKTEIRLRVAQETMAPPEEVESIHFLEPFIILSKRKFMILGIVLSVAVTSAVISLFLPPTFTATTRIMPPQQSQSVAAAMLGQLGPLAGMAGKDLGLRNASDIYIAMLRSETIADALMQRFSLMSVYKAKYQVLARQRLEDSTKIDAGKEGVISLSVSDRDPGRAANLANAYVEELQRLTQTLVVTEAGQRRLFFEREVRKASDELATAEQGLKHTQEKTGIIQLDNQSKAMIESLTGLQAQVAAKEAEVGAMKSYSTDRNPSLIRAESELAALRAELARMEAGQVGSSVADLPLRRVPEAGLEYVQRLREVKYRESLLEVLSKQYEVARIDEAKDAAIVQVLDRAHSPELKSWPHRTVIVLAATFVAFFLGVLIAFVAEAMQRLRADPVSAEKLRVLRFYLFQGLRR